MAEGSFSAKWFKIVLTDIDYWDELHDYLRCQKWFTFGIGVYTIFDTGVKLIFIIVGYAKKVTLKLDTSKIRVLIYKHLGKSSIGRLKCGGEVIWEEKSSSAIQPKITEYFKPG